jgi:peptidoglycan/xylan/chitin deacetylase (PgdA/CDA1 family)
MIIVGYHNVIASPPNAFNRLARKEWERQDEFERQIAALSARFEIVPLQAIVDAIRRGQQIRNACALTFDDGNLGAYQYGLPILEKYRAPATFFIITQKVCEAGKYAPYYFNRLEAMLQLAAARALDLSAFGYGAVSLADDERKAEFYKKFRRKIKITSASEKAQIDESIDRQLDVPEENIAAFLQHEVYQMMRWEQIADLRKRGHEIGSHTRTHPALSQIDAAQLEFEIAGSYADLRERLGLQEIAFAYPFGKPKHVSDAAVDAVKRAGYNCAVMTKEGENTPATNPHRLRRMDFNQAFATHGESLHEHAQRYPGRH